MKEAEEQLRRLTRAELKTLRECILDAAISEKLYGGAKSGEDSEQHLLQIDEKLGAMIRATRGKK